uniref:Uncharacterized protein n=1 Tax=Tetranychus urticae TaxID=32264 RepID=T1L4F3_TETUR
MDSNQTRFTLSCDQSHVIIKNYHETGKLKQTLEMIGIIVG